MAKAARDNVKMFSQESVPIYLENTIVREMVQAILMLDHSKKPFKQSDIVSRLSERPPRKHVNEFLEKAKGKLLDLGVELIETKESPKTFILVSLRAPLEFMYQYAAKEERANRMLLSIALCYIFLKNNKVESQELFNHLQKLGIYKPEDTAHSYFGDVKKKILHEFVEQLYLSTSKLPDSDICEISWGARAEAEVSKKSIIEFARKCGLAVKMSPPAPANF